MPVIRRMIPGLHPTIAHSPNLTPLLKIIVAPFVFFCLSIIVTFFSTRSSTKLSRQRSLKMNDYALSQQLLKHFPTLRGGQVEAAVQIAEQFKDLRQLLVNRKSTKGQGVQGGSGQKVGLNHGYPNNSMAIFSQFDWHFFFFSVVILDAPDTFLLGALAKKRPRRSGGQGPGRRGTIQQAAGSVVASGPADSPQRRRSCYGLDGFAEFSVPWPLHGPAEIA